MSVLPSESPLFLQPAAARMLKSACRRASMRGETLLEAIWEMRRDRLRLEARRMLEGEDFARLELERDRARLYELEARWARIVDASSKALYGGWSYADKVEQAKRNAINGKEIRKHARAVIAARKRGFVGGSSPRRLPTVNDERRRETERYMLELLDGDGASMLEEFAGVTAAAVVAELAEADELRASIDDRTLPS